MLNKSERDIIGERTPDIQMVIHGPESARALAQALFTDIPNLLNACDELESQLVPVNANNYTARIGLPERFAD